jgi:hypothetical protein
MAIAKHIIPGEKFHHFTVVREAAKPEGSPHRWALFRCVCGQEKQYVVARIRRGEIESCGCKTDRTPRRKTILSIGDRFGKLVYVSEAQYRVGNDNRRVTARCDCGTVGEYFLLSLKNGETKSCGCIQKNGEQVYKTHGHTRGKKFSPEYHSWASMITRCENPKSWKYSNYGGRGITVCERWHTFDNFLADMGPRPAGMTLEREKVNEGYSPENCIWATRLRQSNNTRRNTILEYEGRKRTVSEWATEFGLTYNTLLARVHRLKWPVERALKTPPGPSYRR